MAKICVFIYGSLLPGHSNHHVIASHITAFEPGEIEGCLVDVGPYPAAVRSGRNGTGRIRGVWIAVGREGLAAMDALEEFSGMEEMNDYDRVWVSDIADPTMEGWVYVWESNRGYPTIPDDNWPDYWARKNRG